MTFYIKTRSMITIINECLQNKRCAYCLEYTNNNLNKYLPTGNVCGEECEGKYLNNFICRFNEDQLRITLHTEHRSRALWIKHSEL